MLFYGRTQPLMEHPIDQVLAILAQAGFDGVEVCLENEDIGPEVLTEGRAGEVAFRMTELGLGSHSVSYHKDYIYDDHMLELTLRGIELTRSLKSDIFVFSGCRKREDPDTEWQRVVDRTGLLAEKAEQCEVTLALEFEPGFVVGSTAELLRLFDDVGSSRLAANLDLGHMFLEDPDPLDAIGQVGQRCVHCHIENMAKGVHRHLLPDQGDMDLSEYLQKLQAIGFEGGLALDLYGIDYGAESPKALRFLRSLLP